jgi:hypothetical protein
MPYNSIVQHGPDERYEGRIIPFVENLSSGEKIQQDSV